MMAKTPIVILLLIVVQFAIILLPSQTECCDNVYTFPVLLNFLYGHPINVNCQVPSGNASDYHFKLKDHGGSYIAIPNPAQVINDTWLTVNLTSLDLHCGRYSVICSDRAHGNKSCHDFLYVGLPPSKMKVDENRTVLYNWQDLHLQSYSVRTNPTFNVRNQQIHYKSSSDNAQYHNCSYTGKFNNSCIVRNILDTVNNDGMILVRFKARNMMGDYTSVLTAHFLWNMSIPATVTNVTFSKMSPYSNKVCFVPPNIRYNNRTEYQLQWIETFYKTHKNETLRDANLTREHPGQRCYILKDLIPGSLYSVSIQAFSLPKRIPGSPFSSQFNTAESAPLKPLLQVKGGFELHSETRDVIVYWKNVEKRYQGGRLRQIKVQYNCGSMRNTEQIEFSGSYHFTLRNLMHGTDCHVFIEGATSVGYNETLTHSQTGLQIPATIKRPPDNLTATWEQNGDLSLYWDGFGQQLPSNISVFFCMGLISCQGEVMWFDADVTSGEITLPGARLVMNDNSSSVRVGISAVYEDKSTTGIVWADCVYSFKSRPLVPELKAKEHNYNKMIITADTLSCRNRLVAYTYAANIYYCRSDDQQQCSEQPERRSSRISESTVISGLPSNAVYLVWGEAVSWVGVSPNSTELTVKIEGAPLELDQILGLAIGLGLPVLLMLVCGIYGCYRYGKLCPSKVREKLTIKISKPVVNVLTLETSEPPPIQPQIDAAHYLSLTPSPPVGDDSPLLLHAAGNHVSLRDITNANNPTLPPEYIDKTPQTVWKHDLPQEGSTEVTAAPFMSDNDYADGDSFTQTDPEIINLKDKPHSPVIDYFAEKNDDVGKSTVNKSDIDDYNIVTNMQLNLPANDDVKNDGSDVNSVDHCLKNDGDYDDDDYRKAVNVDVNQADYDGTSTTEHIGSILIGADGNQGEWEKFGMSHTGSTTEHMDSILKGTNDDHHDFGESHDKGDNDHEEDVAHGNEDIDTSAPIILTLPTTSQFDGNFCDDDDYHSSSQLDITCGEDEGQQLLLSLPNKPANEREGNVEWDGYVPAKLTNGDIPMLPKI